MAQVKQTGIAALDAIISSTTKKFGKEDLAGVDWGDWEPMSTGSLQLDLALFIGGIPKNRIIEIMGEESSNKTSFALSLIARAQATRRAQGITDRRDLIIDLERSMTRSFIEGFGIDYDQIIWVRPDTAEEALQISIDYAKSGAIDMVLLDSVDAMQNEKQQRRNVGETDVGGISKEMNMAVRQLSKLCAQYNTTYLFINQIKMNPGVMFGSPKTTPGGRALQYYASLRLECMKRTECKDLPGAYTMRVKIIKTRCGPDFLEKLEIPFIHGQGFAEVLDVANVAKELGLLRHSAGQTKVRWTPDDEEGWAPLMEEIDKGKAAAFAALESNSWLLRKLRALCLHASGVLRAPTLEEVHAIGPDDASATA